MCGQIAGDFRPLRHQLAGGLLPEQEPCWCLCGAMLLLRVVLSFFQYRGHHFLATAVMVRYGCAGCALLFCIAGLVRMQPESRKRSMLCGNRRAANAVCSSGCLSGRPAVKVAELKRERVQMKAGWVLRPKPPKKLGYLTTGSPSLIVSFN